MRISAEFTLEMGHRLLNYKGKCRHPHGHSYRVTVTVDGPLGLDGMLVDYGTLKNFCRAYFADWDHSFVLHESDPLAAAFEELKLSYHLLATNPTAECLACYWFENLGPRLRQTLSVRLFSLRVSETATTSAEVCCGE